MVTSPTFSSLASFLRDVHRLCFSRSWRLNSGPDQRVGICWCRGEGRMLRCQEVSVSPPQSSLYSVHACIHTQHVLHPFVVGSWGHQRFGLCIELPRLTKASRSCGLAFLHFENLCFLPCPSPCLMVRFTCGRVGSTLRFWCSLTLMWAWWCGSAAFGRVLHVCVQCHGGGLSASVYWALTLGHILD